MAIDLTDWLNSIYQNKKNLIEDSPENIKDYTPFVINRFLSGNIDTALFANELNERFTMDKEMQYKFLLYAIPAKKRYSSYLRKNKFEDLDAVKTYYNYNNEKALDALKLLTKEQIEYIKNRLNTGGV